MPPPSSLPPPTPFPLSSSHSPAGPPRGILIVIEGLDRAGKSTQCERLHQHLETQKYAAKRMRFPNRSTPTGQSINAYLRGEAHLSDHAIHLLFSANRWEAAAQMRADISAGITLVVDRYIYSGIVYSVAKGLADLSLEWARAPEVGLPRPDLCVFLDIAPEAAAGRGGFGDERYERGEVQERVRGLFYALMRGADAMDISVVDGGQDAGSVEVEIWGLVEKMLRGRETMGPLRAVS